MNNFKTSSILLFLGKGEEKWTVMWMEMIRRKKKKGQNRRYREPDRVAKT